MKNLIDLDIDYKEKELKYLKKLKDKNLLKIGRSHYLLNEIKSVKKIRYLSTYLDDYCLVFYEKNKKSKYCGNIIYNYIFLFYMEDRKIIINSKFPDFKKFKVNEDFLYKMCYTKEDICSKLESIIAHYPHDKSHFPNWFKDYLILR